MPAGAIVTALTGIVAVLAAGVFADRRAGAADHTYAHTAALVFTVIVAVALAQIRRTHPFRHFGPANVVTTIRAMLVAWLAALIAAPATFTPAVATAIASLAIVLDGVDGWLARRYAVSSDFGARFDMEVDALLIIVLSTLAWQYQKAGAWVVLSGLMRYGFVAAALVWPWMGAPLPESFRRKLVCVVQIAALIGVISPLIATPASAVIAAIALAILAWSFAVDVLWLARNRRT